MTTDPAQSLREKSQTDAAWWLHEPLLAYETNVNTLPGCSQSAGWQNHTDPSIEVDHIKASGALQTHMISGVGGHQTNQYCYIRSEQFKEQRRDYLKDYLVQSRKAGYRTIVYFNVHAIKPVFGREQPEWKQIRHDGGTVDNIYGVETAFCVNSPWRDWVRDVCIDLCAYPIDGIFFDGPCFFDDCCYCKWCRELYHRQFGAAMPVKQPGEVHLKELIEFQAQSHRAFFDHSNQAIKPGRPDVLLYGNSGSREEASTVRGRNNRVTVAAQDVLAAEGGFIEGTFREPIWRVGANAKYYQTQAGGKPTLVFNSPAHHPWLCHFLPEAELRLALAQPPIHGSGVWFSDFPWFGKQPEFRAIANDYRYFSENRRFYFNTTSRARIGIVWGFESLSYYDPARVKKTDLFYQGKDGEGIGSIDDEFDGVYDAMVKAHFPSDILDEQSLREEDLSKYDLLILPNVACTGDEADQRLREYVTGGGNVLATSETSFYDERGQDRQRMGLGDLFGIEMRRSRCIPHPHFYFFNEYEPAELFADLTATLLPGPPVSVEVDLRGATMLSPFAVKFAGWDGSEISRSSFPAITLNQFGKGQAIYLAGAFGAAYHTHHPPSLRLLLRNIFSWMSQRDVELQNAPPSVEVTHRAGEGFEAVSMLNYTSAGRPVESVQTLSGIVVRVRTSRDHARALRSDRPLEARRDGDWLELIAPDLELFETIVVE